MGWEEEEEKIDGDGRHLLPPLFFSGWERASPPTQCGGWPAQASMQRCALFFLRLFFSVLRFVHSFSGLSCRLCLFAASTQVWAVGGRSGWQKKIEALNQARTMPDITSFPNYPHAQDGDNGIEAIPSHPLGVKPSGNALLAAWSLRDALGSFQLLPDELILWLLEYLDGAGLLRIGRTCKALYAFARAEDLWKTLFVG